MDFNVFTKDITIKEIKEDEGVKFINELGLDETATAQAIANFVQKSILNLATNKDVFADDDSTVRYLDKVDDTFIIVVRKPFEQKVAKLIITPDLKMSLEFESNGKVQEKAFDEESKLADVIKGFNGCIKTIQK